MDNNQLIENYVDSIVYELDIKNRKEIKEELESVILHILTVECGSETPQKEDVLRVLKRLGNTNFNSKRHFISGIYYHKYKITVRTLVFITCVIITLINLTDYLINHIDSYEFISNIFVYNVIGISIVFTGITIFYCLLERYRMNFEKEIFYSTCSDKTELIKDKDRIQIYEPILDIIISLLFTVIFTGKFSFVEKMFRNTGVYYMIDFKELNKLWYLIVSVGILGIVIAIVKIIDGRYTKRVMVVSIAINLLMIMVTIIICNENTVLSKFNLVRLIIITVIVGDTVITMKKGLKEKDAISNNHISQ
ncbi:hypothetical protein SH1V18_14080 [Vallitalea longa]|uniref:Uncharacterized protein n=1 Tax=Vallitalea longa TaxID=2936439 RepID=A0A9W5YAQ7_9FIRM|nr:hypothetical protein [Vallitalea longa]GKX28928.1 hypothetical protein SH1V18_14080 [Vallitalea longa]